MTLVVRREPVEAAAEWDDFVHGSTGWTPYHRYGWRRIIEDVHAHECCYLGARGADGMLRGVLPLVRVRSLLFGHFLVSMPFLNYGGPLGDQEAVRALVNEAVRAASTHRADLLELRCPTGQRLDLPVSGRKITVLLDLPAGDPAPLWDGLKAKVRSQVRRPMKEGVQVRFGPDELDAFYQVFAHHMRDLGSPVQPKRWFERAREEFGPMMWFGCAYSEGRPVAAGAGFRWSDRFELVWASALRAYNRLAPNMLLYWRFLERCVEDGARLFDFGRCTPGSGTHAFKQQWGGRDEPLAWYYRASGRPTTPSPDDAAYAWGPRLWRRLPVRVATVLGPHIVRAIP